MDKLHSLSPHFAKEELQQRVLAWYSVNKEAHSWRLLWQQFRDPYFVWISEIMLQQTTLAAVIPKYDSFIKRFPKIEALVLASEAQIKREVQGLGYYRRFSNLHKGMQQVLEASPGDTIAWPQTYAEWLKIPGVGEYTAAALSSITLDEPEPVLDGNVIRVLSRIFDIRRASDDRELKKILMTLARTLICASDPGSYNQALMELGQKICRPQSPACKICPLQKICLAYARQSTHLAPQAKTRAQAENLQVRIHILKKAQRFGLFKRCQNAKFLKCTPGFVTELSDQEQFRIDGEDFSLPGERYLGTFQHTITKHRLKVDVFSVTWQAHWRKSRLLKEGLWLAKSEVATQLVSSLDMKAWKLVTEVPS